MSSKGRQQELTKSFLSLNSILQETSTQCTTGLGQGLQNVSEKLDYSLSSNLKDINAKLINGSAWIRNGLDEFSSHSQKQLNLLAIIIRLSDQTLSNALSDLSKTLDEKLSAMVAFKPVFDLSHGITREAREKVKDKERNVG